MSDRKSALNRVKAAYASLNDKEFTTGAFQTNDIRYVLDKIALLEEKLKCVGDDLSDLLILLPVVEKEVIKKMLESTLAVVDYDGFF